MNRNIIRMFSSTGINLFLSRGPRIAGSVKKTHHDFEVREIDSFGEIADLTDKNLPSTEERNAIREKVKQKTLSKDKKNDDLMEITPENAYETIIQIVGQEVAETIRNKAESIPLHTAVANSYSSTLQLQISLDHSEKAKLFHSISELYPHVNVTLSNQEGALQFTFEQIAKFHSLVPLLHNPDDLELILRFLQRSNRIRSVTRATIGPQPDKDLRKRIHIWFKDNFPFIHTNHNADGIELVRRRQEKRNRGEFDWNDCFVEFVLRKEWKESGSAVKNIARALNVSPSAITLAGTKDKIATTYQKARVRGVNARQVQSINDKNLFGIAVGNFKYVESGFNLGNAWGNYFRIRLRDVECTDAVSDLINTWHTKGFINYFGYQRVGKLSYDGPSGCDIGLSIIKGDWESAVRQIFDPRGSRSDKVREIKQRFLDTNDLNVLGELSENFHVEHAIAKALHRYGIQEYFRAIQAIPYNSRLLYVHAYQSRVWNNMASFRINRYGNQVVAGDLVWTDPIETLEDLRANRGRETCDRKETDLETELDSGSSKRRKVECHSQNRETETGVEQDAVSIATQEQAESRIYPLSRVVLPLPGKNIIYPENEVRDAYLAMLERDGLPHWFNANSPDEHATESKIESEDLLSQLRRVGIRNGTLGGGYRALIHCPQQVQFALLSQEPPLYPSLDPEEKMGDSSQLWKIPIPWSSETETKGEGLNRPIEDSVSCIELGFALAKSCYATVALRELIGDDIAEKLD